MHDSKLAYPGLLMWKWLARFALRRFRLSLADGPAVNRSALVDILARSQDTVIGKRLGFREILRAKDPESAYRHSVALADYGDFADSIGDIAAGAEGLLFPGAPTLFVATSGTSADPKLLPTTKRAQNIYLKYIAFLVPAMRMEAAPRLRLGQRSINLMLASNPGNTLPGGKVMGMSSAGGMRKVLWAAPFIWTSPGPVFELTKHETALYLHALFGLADASAGCIEAIFGSHIVSWMSLMMNWQDELLDDLAHGRINARLDLSPEERRKVSGYLRPDPARARDLRQAFAGGEAGIIRRLWPDMQVLSTVISGSFAVSLPRLKRMAGDGVAIYTTCFGATESMVGINLWPDEPEKYALSIGAAYYEFLPLTATESDFPQSVRMEDLCLGESYEVVITNYAGLYRYRLGDVCRVAGQIGSTPMLEFGHRLGTVLDLVGEKTTEQHTQQVVLELAGEALESPSSVTNYTVRGDYSVTPYRYLVYLELADESMAEQKDCHALEELFDRRLQAVNLSYKTLARSNHRLSPARLKMVKAGAFRALEDYLYAQSPGISRNQIKVSRVIRDEQLIRILEDSVIA